MLKTYLLPGFEKYDMPALKPDDLDEFILKIQLDMDQTEEDRIEEEKIKKSFYDNCPQVEYTAEQKTSLDNYYKQQKTKEYYMEYSKEPYYYFFEFNLDNVIKHGNVIFPDICKKISYFEWVLEQAQAYKILQDSKDKQIKHLLDDYFMPLLEKREAYIGKFTTPIITKHNNSAYLLWIGAEDDREKLYNILIDKKYTYIDYPKDQFVKRFQSEDIKHDLPPIKWLKSNRELYELMVKLKASNNIQDDDYWVKAAMIFIDKDGKNYDSNNLRSTKKQKTTKEIKNLEKRLSFLKKNNLQLF